MPATPPIAPLRVKSGWYRRVGKRTFDIVGAAAAIVVLLPLAAAVALIVRVFLGSPVLFRQSRPGLNGVPFGLVKFRTMTDRRDHAGSLLPDSERLGWLGRFLRAASLDELPELWNVLVGEMSLVGPRPLLLAYLDRYTPRQARRHLVRPGITGLAQVSGRNGLSWEEKFELDGEYVDRCSFALDVRILARTIWQVLLRRDINQPGHATAEEFTGNGDAMRVVIVGAGGHGQVVADMIAAGARVGDHELKLVGFLDDDPGFVGTDVGGVPVLGNLDSIGRVAADAFVVAIGSNPDRARIAQQLQSEGRRLISIQHPHTSVSRNVTVGDGTMVSAGAVVVTGARIGLGVILNTGCTVDHHSHVGDYAHIAPGVHLGGEVAIGGRTLVGIGAVVLPRCRVGAGCTIGAGAVVIGDVPDGATAVGVPARLFPSPLRRGVTSHLLVDR